MARHPLLKASATALLLGLAGCSSVPTAPAPVVYSCDDGSVLRAQFGAEVVVITLADGTALSLPQQRVASGIWYATPQYTLRGKGDEATWTVGRRTPVACQVRR
jgi:membrane-bound inhibitor of C-type lysozyme